VRLEIAAQSDKGRRKKKNEDYYGVFRDDLEDLSFFDEGAMLCVADGLGGHVGGEIASKLAVTHMRDMLLKSDPPEPEGDDPPDPVPILKDWVVRANANVHQTNIDLVQAERPMGTTLLTVLVGPRKAFIANVGDSRCYHIRDNDIIDMTEDHSWVDEQVKLGLMSKAEAAVDQRKNIVTRCVGTHESVEVDTYTWNVVPEDQLLLCTDGLVNMVEDKDIIAEFKSGGTSAEIAQRLVHLANENGGKDNITVIITEISPGMVRLIFSRLRSFWRRQGAQTTWLLVGTLAVLGGVALGYWLGMIDVFGLK
jgi:protein phosphatase